MPSKAPPWALPAFIKFKANCRPPSILVPQSVLDSLNQSNVLFMLVLFSPTLLTSFQSNFLVASSEKATIDTKRLSFELTRESLNARAKAFAAFRAASILFVLFLLLTE